MKPGGLPVIARRPYPTQGASSNERGAAPLLKLGVQTTFQISAPPTFFQALTPP